MLLGEADGALGAAADVEVVCLEQLQGFGSAARDPRRWTATFAYVALIAAEALALRHGPNAEEAAWWPLHGEMAAPPLAFDHTEIVAAAARRLRGKVEYTVHLLPEKFTLPDLQRVCEQILGRRMDKSAFRKKIAEFDFLEPVANEKRPASNRPAQIYRIKPGLKTTLFDRAI